MAKLKKRAIWVAKDEATKAISILKKAGITALSDTSVFGLNLQSVVVTSFAWVIIIIIVALLN